MYQGVIFNEIEYGALAPWITTKSHPSIYLCAADTIELFKCRMCIFLYDKMKENVVAKEKSLYISPSCEYLSVNTFGFFCTSVEPTTTGSTEPDFKDEERKEWGEIEF